MRGFYFTIIFSTVLSLAGLSSCSYHSDKQSNQKSGLSADSEINTSYIQENTLKSCTRCHSGGHAPRLTTGQEIRDSIAKISDEVTTNAMPPAYAGYTPLSECQKKVLSTWISMGMPETSSTRVSSIPECKDEVGAPNTPSTPQSILDMPLNYATLESEILQPRCLHCHNPQSDDIDAKYILLAPYNNLVAHKSYFTDSHTTSKFYRTVAREDDERMPPPEDSEALSAEQLEFIARWIDAGHPEK